MQPTADILSAIGTIPYETAYRAYTGTSFSPEKRAAATISDYVQGQVELYENLSERAAKYGDIEIFNEEFKTYCRRYRDKYLSWLHTRSGIVSTMIAGPSNFPVRQMQKRNNAEHAKVTDLIQYEKWFINKVELKYRPESQKPIQAGKEGSLQKLQDKLEGLERSRETMKQANGIIRKAIKNKETVNNTVDQLTKLGYSEADARSILAPRFGPPGFRPYVFSNLGQEISRIKERIASEKALGEQKDKGNIEYPFDNGTVLANFDDNRWQIFFNSKPDEAVRTALKKNAFKWSPNAGAWQRQLNTYSINWIVRLEFLPGLSNGKRVGAPEPEPIDEPEISDENFEAEKPEVTDEEVNALIDEMEQAEPEPEPAHQPAQPGERFSKTFELDREKIIVDPKRFQGRQTDFSRDTVNAIVSKGNYDKSGEPIIVWFDAALDKYIVISGHSRFEATGILLKSGKQPDLKTIPVKEFIGTDEQAADFAVLESNRGSTQEGLKSDIAAYKRAISKGYNKEYLMTIFKPESKIYKLRDLSHLNPQGRFLEYLDTPAEKSFPYIERNATWVGQIRSKLPQITDLHENEIFDYLYKDNKKGLTLSKDKFFQLIDKRVNRIDFEQSKPLNLNNVVSSNSLTNPIVEQINDIDREIEKLNREREAKLDLIIRARQEGKTELIPKFQERLNDIQKIVLRKLEERDKLQKSVGRIERETVFDLFSMPAAPEPKPEPVPEPDKPKGKKPKDPRTREQIKKQYDDEIKQVEPEVNRNLSEQQVIALGLKINATRSLYSQFIDNSSDNKRRLSPTPENLLRWMHAPGKYDLIGVDTFERVNPTADYKTEIKKQKLFNLLGIKS